MQSHIQVTLKDARWVYKHEFVHLSISGWSVCVLAGFVGHFYCTCRGVVLACVVLGQGVEWGVGWMVMRLNSLGSVVIWAHLAAAPSAFRWLAQPHLSKELLNNLVLPNPHQPCWETERGPKRETVGDTFFLPTHMEKKNPRFWGLHLSVLPSSAVFCLYSSPVSVLWFVSIVLLYISLKRSPFSIVSNVANRCMKHSLHRYTFKISCFVLINTANFAWTTVAKSVSEKIFYVWCDSMGIHMIKIPVHVDSHWNNWNSPSKQFTKQ